MSEPAVPVPGSADAAITGDDLVSAEPTPTIPRTAKADRAPGIVVDELSPAGPDPVIGGSTEPSATDLAPTEPAPAIAPTTEPAITADDLAPGITVTLEIGSVAHGGHFVARYDNRVVFVRHALPGELAVVRISEARPKSFCRGDAIEILRSSADRVVPPCIHFVPQGCGGCDFQHASAPLQRRLKASVVSEQLRRLAGVELPIVVEQLAGGEFGWRSRVRWGADAGGWIGPRKLRSHEVVHVDLQDPCLIAADGLTELALKTAVPARVLSRPTPEGTGPGWKRRHHNRRPLPEPEVVLVAAGDGGELAIWPGDDPPTITEFAAGYEFEVAADGFWQVHPAAADALAEAVRRALEGFRFTKKSAWDLYGGVGLFARLLADLVGPDGTVVTVESDTDASDLAEVNLRLCPQVTVATGRVEKVLPVLGDRVDVVVLDPPRTGAGPAVCADIASRKPSVIIYVACDPAALGRDTAALLAAGYRLDSVRAFDAFPQTQHVECVARFVPVD